MPTPTDNRDEIAEWNGVIGQRWATGQQQVDGIVRPFGNAALALADAQPGERVLDVGCGGGDTALALAQRVGRGGQVLGVDVSQPLLAVARARAAAEALPQLAFDEADASAAALPTGLDLLFSRFGVMFFAQPEAAFAHLRRHLRPGGRCVFVCWRAPRDNPWAMAPLSAARQALGIVNPPPADPLAPGPFAFADGDRLQRILAGAGFDHIDVQRLDLPVRLGASAREAAAHTLHIGPASRLLREAGADKQPLLATAIEQALAPLAAADGSIDLTGSTWCVSARAG